MTEKKQKCTFCKNHNKKANMCCSTFTDLEVNTDEEKKLWIWTGESMDYLDEDDDVTGRYYPRYCPECGRKLD